MYQKSQYSHRSSACEQGSPHSIISDYYECFAWKVHSRVDSKVFQTFWWQDQPAINLGGWMECPGKWSPGPVSSRPQCSSDGSGQLLFSYLFLFFFCFLFFAFSRATPVAHGSSQARGLTGAVAASLRHSHSNTRSEPSLWSTPQLTATPDP